MHILKLCKIFFYIVTNKNKGQKKSYFIELSIGLQNVWLGCLIMILLHTIVSTNKKLSKRMGDMSWYTSYEKKLAIIISVLMFSFYIISIWIPLKIGTLWFYIGIVIFILGFSGNIISTYNYATAPENETITKGMYRISRNPLYFYYGLMILGLTIASLSVFLFILWISITIVTHLIILTEEQYCLKTYGSSYQEYMQKVPRYFLFF